MRLFPPLIKLQNNIQFERSLSYHFTSRVNVIKMVFLPQILFLTKYPNILLLRDFFKLPVSLIQLYIFVRLQFKSDGGTAGLDFYFHLFIYLFLIPGLCSPHHYNMVGLHYTNLDCNGMMQLCSKWHWHIGFSTVRNVKVMLQSITSRFNVKFQSFSLARNPSFAPPAFSQWSDLNILNIRHLFKQTSKHLNKHLFIHMNFASFCQQLFLF